MNIRNIFSVALTIALIPIWLPIAIIKISIRIADSFISIL
jgi:hypothetical protein